MFERVDILFTVDKDVDVVVWEVLVSEEGLLTIVQKGAWAVCWRDWSEGLVLCKDEKDLDKG
jgi:hypothetical protein